MRIPLTSSLQRRQATTKKKKKKEKRKKKAVGGGGNKEVEEWVLSESALNFPINPLSLSLSSPMKEMDVKRDRRR